MAMIYYFTIVSILNLCLGFGLAKYLEHQTPRTEIVEHGTHDAPMPPANENTSVPV
jgi:hypothetical protein